MKLKKLLAFTLALAMALSTMSFTVFADEPNGSITPGYMDSVSVWGEGGGNATESLVIELYAGETKLAMTSLNDYEGIIDGEVYVTWHIYTDGRDGDADPYWHTEWYVEPTSNVVPDKVVMLVDGVQVAENKVQMNAPDNLNKTDWEELEGVEYVAPVHVVMTDGTIEEYTSLAQAMADHQFLNAVEKIVVNQDIAEDMSWSSDSDENNDYPVFNGIIESGHPNGVTITNTVEDYVYMDSLTISKNVHFKSNGVFYQSGENYVYGKVEVIPSDGIYYQGYNAKVYIKDGGSVSVDGSVINRYHTDEDAGIYIEGDSDDSTVEFYCSYYIGTYSGVFSVKDANVEAGYVLFKNSYDADKNNGYADAEMTLDNSSITVIGTGDGQNSFQIDANTTITMTNGSAIEDVRDFNILAGANLDLSVDKTSSISATNVSVADDVKLDAIQNADGSLTFAKIFDGEGTVESPYLINALEDLKAFRDNVNNGVSYKGKYIKLAADIDLNNEEWTPIGNSTNKFEGYFDGNNKTVSKLLVSGNNDYAGFFGYVLGKGMDANTEASVKNLTLDGVSVSGGYRVGGLSGQGYTCKIENVTVKGNVSGTRYVGGLIGHVYTYFDNCHFIGDVSGTFDAIGGIAGAGDGRVYNSSVIGDVTGSNWVGGIIANGQEGTSVVGCYVKGTVSTSSNFYFGVGGIAGVGGHGYNGSVIKDNYFDGEVFLCGEKVNAIVVGFINADDNASIGTTVDGNSWNTEYYPADTPVVVTAEVVDADSSPEDWAASASVEKSSVRNNNLVMLESDLEYVDAASAEDVAIMPFSEVSEEAVATAVAENKFKVFVDANENGVLDEGEVKYTDVQEAIKAASPDGTVVFLRDATVDEWVMFAESLSIGNDDLITLVIDGLIINGNDHTLTINSIESAGNGGRLFYDATNLNINDLTIKYADGVAGGIGLKSGIISNVTFEGGVYGVIPQDGDITIDNCTFATNGTAIYYEDARDNLKVTNNTFNQPDEVNVILLRGNTTFTGNIVNSGRTVNVVSGSPLVDGNIFNNDVRFKVYNNATGVITNNTITNLVFNDATPVLSTFTGNTLSDSAKEALEGAGLVVNYTLTFVTNGGSALASVVVAENGVISLSQYQPEREGYRFGGWYADEALTQKVTEVTLDSNKTIYAKWSENRQNRPISGLPGGGGGGLGTNKTDDAEKPDDTEEPADTEKPADTETTGFTDLDAEAWYYEVVNAAIEKGLMNGMSETEFAPNANLTRGMFVTILYRADGEPAVESESLFADVVADQYYTNAVIWAAANGIVTGMTEDTFAPDENITREQMAAIISRYLSYKEIAITDGGEVTYTDQAEIAEYAMDAVKETKWAGLLEGNADGSFAPKRNTTRAEAAALFVRLLNILQ